MRKKITIHTLLLVIFGCMLVCGILLSYFAYCNIGYSDIIGIESAVKYEQVPIYDNNGEQTGYVVMPINAVGTMGILNDDDTTDLSKYEIIAILGVLFCCFGFVGFMMAITMWALKLH